MGGWEDVQVELGLKSPEEVEQRQPKRLAEALFLSTAHVMTFHGLVLSAAQSSTHVLAAFWPGLGRDHAPVGSCDATYSSNATTFSVSSCIS